MGWGVGGGGDWTAWPLKKKQLCVAQAWQLRRKRAFARIARKRSFVPNVMGRGGPLSCWDAQLGPSAKPTLAFARGMLYAQPCAAAWCSRNCTTTASRWSGIW